MAARIALRNAASACLRRIGQPHRLLLLRARLLRPFLPGAEEPATTCSGARAHSPAFLYLLKLLTTSYLTTYYQDDFETPEFLPQAKPRKHRRQIPNLRR